MQYYLYIPLPARLGRRIAAIRRRYPCGWRSAPHITVVIPRTLARGRRERDVVDALGRALASVAPCAIRYRGVAYFGRKDFIYVPVHKTPGLRAVRAACVAAVTGILEQDRPDRFLRPHITLAGPLQAGDGDRAWRALSGRAFDGRFACRHIALWRMGRGDVRWRLVRRFPLQGSG